MDRRLLKAARAALGWSQAELAERAGVQRLVVVRYENGSQVPHARTMNNIIEALRRGGVDEIYREDGAAGIVLNPNFFD